MSGLKDTGCKITAVLQIYDHAAFRSQDDEGEIRNLQTLPDEKQHVIGDLIMAPSITLKKVVENSAPILKALGAEKKVMIAPFPRFLHKSCCSDAKHITNRDKPEYKDDILKGVAGIKNSLKKHVYDAGIRETIWINASTIVEVYTTQANLDRHGGGDDMHPPMACYKEVLETIKTMCKNQARESPAQKRAADGQPTASSHQQKSRRTDNQTWTSQGTSTGEYRSDRYAAERGRGRPWRGSGYYRADYRQIEQGESRKREEQARLRERIDSWGKCPNRGYSYKQF